VGSAVGKPIHKPEINFYDPFFLYISDLYGFTFEKDIGNGWLNE